MKLLVVFLFLNFLPKPQGQWQDDVKRDLLTFSAAVSEKKFDKALRYVNEKAFEITSRDEFRKEWTAMTDTSEAIFRYSPPVFKSFGEIVNVGEEKFVKFEITQFLRVKPQITTTNGLFNTHELKVMTIRLELEAIFGPENMRYNSETSTFTIQLQETIVGNFDADAKHWKFVNLSQNPKKNYKVILPPEVVN